ncbi:lactate racemase domain-containing protein [Natronococcus sp. A-GB7]|uniref:lactate racemase domain-containing protein n=1 Tax=Natronococcus sp. A-GB7 TaxID=3037649 RepID=UPI00241F35AD|nr:lactate racemase domain-containing protein [Natronococcus sp. A-GB7]MDG5821109.1 lactate racemase domain-containing protein [Natronococcus sp. A-GB7]
MNVPLGSGSIDVSLPNCDVTVAEPPGGEVVDVQAAAQRALEEPLGSPLAERIDAGDDVVIVVTDLTREAPDDVLLDVLLERLADLGVAREQVTVVVGLGLHRPMTDAELEAMLGPHADLAVNHDPESVVEVGRVDGVPVEIGTPVANADAVLSTGVVEPHQYAGFSGGAKTVAIGAGSESLIRYTHGPETLAREGVRLGRVEGNPFRELLDEAGDLVGIDFSLNLTHGPTGVLGVRAGDDRRIVRELATVARDALSVPVEREYDAVVCGVGAPKDANLYQATRGATYVALGDRNPLRKGGKLVVPAALSEGAGEGTGERRFYRRLSEADDAESLYSELREGYDPGAQRAFVVARVLREHEIVVTNSEAPDVVEECLMRAEPGVCDAVEPGSDVLLVPDALNTLLVERR